MIICYGRFIQLYNFSYPMIYLASAKKKFPATGEPRLSFLAIPKIFPPALRKISILTKTSKISKMPKHPPALRSLHLDFLRLLPGQEDVTMWTRAEKVFFSKEECGPELWTIWTRGDTFFLQRTRTETICFTNNDVDEGWDRFLEKAVIYILRFQLKNETTTTWPARNKQLSCN